MDLGRTGRNETAFDAFAATDLLLRGPLNSPGQTIRFNSIRRANLAYQLVLLRRGLRGSFGRRCTLRAGASSISAGALLESGLGAPERDGGG